MRRVIYLMAGIILCFSSCDKAYEDQSFRAWPEQTLGHYLADLPEFSDWVAVLKRTGYYSLLNISSTEWTHFVAKNEALQKYAKELGYDAILDMPTDELTEIVKYHTIPNYKISARNMSGKISRRTGTKDYLTAVYDYSADWRYISNGEGNEVSTIIQPDIEALNGYIQVLDRPLVLVFDSIWDVLKGWKDDSGNPTYSLFCEALQKTGLDEYLKRQSIEVFLGPVGQKRGVTVKEEKTLLAVPDSVYNDYEIYNYEQLQKYVDDYNEGTTTDPASQSSYIYQYMEYHIFDKRMGYSDLVLFPLRPYDYDNATRLKRNQLFPRSSIKDLQKGIAVEDQLSEIVFNPHETANNNSFTIVLRDQPASNGYIHVISNLGLKTKKMAFFPFEFELTDALEFTAIDFYRDQAELNAAPRTYEIYEGDIPHISWVSTSSDAMVWYSNVWMPISTANDGDKSNRYKNYDALYWSLGTIGQIDISLPIMPSTGNDMRMWVYVEKSNDEYLGGKYHVTYSRSSLGENRDFKGGATLAKWDGIRVGDFDALGIMTFKVGDVAGEAGIDRLIFIPTWSGGTAVPEEGWYNWSNN